jgi:hypothetical protein
MNDNKLDNVKNSNSNELLNQFIDNEDYKIEPSEKLNKLMNRLKGGSFYTQIFTCKGKKKCPYKGSCPFDETENYPEGEKCPVEMMWAKNYLENFKESLSIKVTDYKEVSLMEDLVETQLMINRAQGEISEKGLIMVYHTMTEDGKLAEVREQNPMINVIDRLQNKKIKLLEQFNATRKTNKNDGKETQRNVREKMKNIKAKQKNRG